MKPTFPQNDIIRIQLVSRLSDLLFDELQKIKLDPLHSALGASTSLRSKTPPLDSAL